MATVLYPTNRTYSGIGNFFNLSNNPQSVACAEAANGVVTATVAGTQIQWTRTAGGTVLEWITGRSPAGGWTLAGTVTFQIIAQESAMSTNIGARARLFKRTAAGSETEVAGGPYDDGVEFTNGTDVVFTWTGTPTSTAFAEDDRLIVRFYITNAGGTMAAGTGTIRYNYRAAVGGSTTNQTQITLTETVVFKSDATAFGQVVGASFNNVASIPDPFSPTQPITVEVGDLIFVNVAENTALSSVGCSDSLGNTYTALNTGTNGGANVAAFFSVADFAGACDPDVNTTAAAHTACIACVVYKGPFAASPLDVNTTAAADATLPYTANATGTLAQADELVIAYIAGEGSASADLYTSPTPSGSDISAVVPGDSISGPPCGVIALVVSSTSSVTMAVSGSAARNSSIAVATFKADVVPEDVTVDKWFVSFADVMPPLAGLGAQYQDAFEIPTHEQPPRVDWWFLPWSEPLYALSGLAAQQQEEFGIPPLVEEEVTVDKWFVSFADVKPPTPGLGPAYQAIIAQVPFNEDVFVDEWFEAWSEPPLPLSGLLVAYQEEFGLSYFVEEEVTVDKWFVELSKPTPALPGLGAEQQLALTDVPFNEDIFLDMWFEPWAEPTPPLSGLLAAYQEEFGLSYFVEEEVTVDKWFIELSGPTPALPGLGASQQLALTDVPFIEDIFFDMWFQPFSEPTPSLPGLLAALQEAFGQPYFVEAAEEITVDKWYVALSEPLYALDGLAARYQEEFGSVPFEDSDFEGWFYPWSEPLYPLPGLAAQQQLALTDVPFVEDTFLDMWFEPWSEPTPPLSGLLAAYQEAFGQQYVVFEEITVDKWFAELSRPTPALPGLGAEQQLAITDVPFEEDIFLDMWFLPWSDPTPPLAGLGAAYQEDFGYAVFFEPDVSVDMWFTALSEPTSALPGLGAAQPVIAQVPFNEDIFVDMWFAPWADPLYPLPGLRAADQDEFGSVPFEDDSDQQIWFAPWSEPTPPLPGLRAEYQEAFAGQSHEQAPTVTVDMWFGHLSDPTAALPGLGAMQQLSLTDVPFEEDITVDMWFEAWSEPTPSLPGLHASNQIEFGETPIEVSNLQNWFSPLSDPIRLPPGLHAAYQDEFVTSLFVEPAVEYWYYPWSDPVRSSPEGMYYPAQQEFGSSPFVAPSAFNRAANFFPVM